MDEMYRNVAIKGAGSWRGKIFALWMALFAVCAFAQAPAAEGGVAPPMSAAELDQLVGPIALYPDDLVAIILPSATYPLEIVQADRYLDKRKSDKNLPVNDAWQESIKSLLNYPDVVKKMSTDIDWTADLGEAVVADQGAVLESIQRFRRQVQAAGNLKSDDKQTVIVEKEVIQVVQANPEVIYVPQYNPSTIVVAGGYSSYGYWPAPYPVYYYPYPPGAALATGLIWGAAIGAAWNGGRWGCNYGGGNNDININRSTNINTGGGNTINRGSGNSAKGTSWKSDKKPGQVSSGAGRSANSARVGDAQRGGGDRQGAGAGDRQGAGGDRQGAGGDRQGAGGGARASNQPASRASSGMSDRGSASASDRSAQNRGGGGGDAFGGYGSGSSARADSSRGASSRDSMSSSGRSQSFQGGGGGGGGRASAGGGGGRSGGGGGMRGGGGGRR